MVTHFPSLPAKGESFTEKVISTVGSDIFTNLCGSTQSGEHTVSPMFIFSRPEKQTISPAIALSQGTRLKPSIW